MLFFKIVFLFYSGLAFKFLHVILFSSDILNSLITGELKQL